MRRAPSWANSPHLVRGLSRPHRSRRGPQLSAVSSRETQMGQVAPVCNACEGRRSIRRRLVGCPDANAVLAAAILRQPRVRGDEGPTVVRWILKIRPVGTGARPCRNEAGRVSR
jgi:hypothetical protein